MLNAISACYCLSSRSYTNTHVNTATRVGIQLQIAVHSLCQLQRLCVCANVNMMAIACAYRRQHGARFSNSIRIRYIQQFPCPAHTHTPIHISGSSPTVKEPDARQCVFLLFLRTAWRQHKQFAQNVVEHIIDLRIPYICSCNYEAFLFATQHTPQV